MKKLTLDVTELCKFGKFQDLLFLSLVSFRLMRPVN